MVHELLLILLIVEGTRVEGASSWGGEVVAGGMLMLLVVVQNKVVRGERETRTLLRVVSGCSTCAWESVVRTNCAGLKECPINVSSCSAEGWPPLLDMSCSHWKSEVISWIHHVQLRSIFQLHWMGRLKSAWEFVLFKSHAAASFNLRFIQHLRFLLYPLHTRPSINTEVMFASASSTTIRGAVAALCSLWLLSVNLYLLRQHSTLYWVLVGYSSITVRG